MSRILIIEDSSSVAQHLADILQAEQYQTQIALSGHDALSIIKGQSFEIILLDLVLPDISGIQILKKLRQKFQADVLPIIVISSVTNESEIEKALQSGANDFIQKPFSELILKVKTKNLLHLQHKTIETNLNNKVMQDIFESTPVISFLVDKDVRILKTNHSGKRFFKKTGSELSGMLAGNAIQCLNAVSNNGRCGQTGFCTECVIRNAVNYTFKTQKAIYRNEGSFHLSNEKNTKAMDFLISTSPIVYNGSNAVLLSIEDITNERMALRDARDTSDKLAKAVLELKLSTNNLNKVNIVLSQQEQKLRAIFNAFNVGISITNPEGKYIMFNDWWLEHLGYSRNEMSQMSFLDITYPEDTDISSIRFGKLIKKEISQYRTEKRFVRKNKSLFWGDLSVSAIYDCKGDITHVIGIISDITQLKEARESLLKSEAALLEAQKIGNTAHWEFDLITGQFFWSEQAFQIFDLKPEDFVVTYKNVMQLLHPNDREIFEQAHQDCIYKKIPINMEYQITTSINNTKYLLERAQTIYDENDTPIQTIGTITDITAQKFAELKIAKQNEDLKNLNATKDKFFSIMSHDLKNAFTSILGLSELMAKDYEKLSKDERIEFVRLINQTSKNTFSLLENLLHWARSQNGNIPFSPQKLNLSLVVDECCEVLKNQALIKNIELKNNVPPNIFIQADIEMLKTTIRNIASNAIKFTQNNGAVIINANISNNHVEVSVIDNGTGMDDKTKNSLFNLAETKSKKGTSGEMGTGLGLILCKEFVLKHGGSIKVESQINKGTTISFTIPLA